MHLLHCSLVAGSDQLSITLCEYFPEEVQYAILSHKWGLAEDEVSHRDLIQNLYRQKKGYHKIEACCRQALRDGLSYAWIDTCCIDKSSSSELSEAINSMYEWYTQSSVCYAYLQDVQIDEDYSHHKSSFRTSQWFTRGWTLQELIAPNDVIFYAAGWKEIGRKSQLAKTLHDITRVSECVLLSPREALPRICISQIMYWASGRRTTRKEDRAYSLLGLFRINLPILYGEGNSAFMRLQAELVRVYLDHTVFAWHLKSSSSGLLADCPDAFAYSGDVRKLPLKLYNDGKPNEFRYTLSNLGLEIKLPYRKGYGRLDLYVADIACYIDTEENKLCLLLKRHYGGLDGQYFRTRLPSGSLSSSDNMTFLNYEVLTPRKRFWIVQPAIEWERAIRPLPQGNFTEEDIFDEKRIKYFWIKLELKSKIIYPEIRTAYPMPNKRYCENISHRDHGYFSRRNGIKIETEAGVVWVASIFRSRFGSGPYGEVNVLLAVIENELMSHMEFKVNSTGDVSDNFQSCIEFYERCKGSSDPPCTLIDGIHGRTESANLRDTIIYMEKSSVFKFDNRLRCFEARINFVNRKELAVYKQTQEGWGKTTPGKSLKELLAECKPISAHLSKENYNDDSIMFYYAPANGNPSLGDSDNDLGDDPDDDPDNDSDEP